MDSGNVGANGRQDGTKALFSDSLQLIRDRHICGDTWINAALPAFAHAPEVDCRLTITASALIECRG
jgi:hypothetical protein